MVLVREEFSLQQIQQAKVTNPQLFLQPDMAFSFPAAPSKEASQWLQSYGLETGEDTPLLGVTAINWGAQTGQHTLQVQYESALAGAIRYFVERQHGRVVFFPQVTGAVAYADDRLPAGRVIESMRDLGDQVLLIDQPPAPELLKAAYGLMDIFIGTRMHSNIFALSQGVPVLAIAYRHKTQGIMHMLGLDEWCIDIQSASGPALTGRLAALWEQRSAVSEHIQQALPAIIEASRRAGILIADNFVDMNKKSLASSA
jgi:colanic acid/amylovoran biosynthesis protein